MYGQNDQNTCEIPLTQGYVAIVDASDYEYLSQWKWHAVTGKGGAYARRTIRTSEGFVVIFMHRLLLDAPHGMYIDHIDGNTLNNSRANLRICTTAQNGRNRKKQSRASSQFKGISWSKQNQKWDARIRKNRSIFIGLYDQEADAAKAYDEKAIELFGEFARLNFPRGS